MGGHSSKQTISASNSILTKATLNQTQNCVAVAAGENVISLNGNYNTLSNVSQGIKITLDADCAQKEIQKDDFESKLQNDISQQLKSQDVAMTSWLSAGSDDQEANINNSVATMVQTNVIQTCYRSLSARNVINIRGSGNVLENIAQDQAATMVSNCYQSTEGSMKTTTDMTNIINQALSHIDENPFAFITDAIKAAVESVAVIVGIVILAIVVMVILAKHLSHKKKKGQLPVYVPMASQPGAAV